MDNRVNIAVIIGVVFVLAFAVTLTQSENQVESQVVEDEIPESVILGGPPPIAPSGSAAVAYPATSSNSITGRATFTELGYSSNPVCFSAITPVGVQLTITNINNGRSLKCTSAFGVNVPAGVTVQLNSTQFTQLADLIDAPIPVKITW